jgi:hypothetical protein
VQNPPVVGGGSTPCRLTAADTAVWLRQAGRSCVLRCSRAALVSRRRSVP